LGSYYFTALMYYVGHGGSHFSPDYIFWSLVLAPAVSGVIAFLGLKPHKLHGQAQHAARPAEEGSAAGSDTPQHQRGWGFLVWLVAVFVFRLALGFEYSRFVEKPRTPATATAVPGQAAAPAQH
jgi:hypothetical protein